MIIFPKPNRRLFLTILVVGRGGGGGGGWREGCGCLGREETHFKVAENQERQPSVCEELFIMT